MYTCRICGWIGKANTINVKEMHYNMKEEFEYFECGNCHCLQISEIPDNMGAYYGDTYYSYAKPSIEKPNDNPEAITTPILDVGCGAGKFLCKLAQLGYTNLIGCDPFIENDIVYENGVHIYKKEIHEMTGQFDNIFLNDSFEHVTDPHEVMDSIKRLLAPNGIVQIKIPVYPNIAYDMFGTDWFQIDAPRHITLHSKESISALAAEHGLCIIKREYDSGADQIVRSHLYSIGIPLCEQTNDVVYQHFSRETIDDIIESCKMANENEYGDHAVFYLTHANNNQTF